MSNTAPHILLVNPWIHDFAAYDVWAKPLGLLTLAAILRDHGCAVTYLDCLDRFHPQDRPQDPARRNGRGPYRKQRLPKPPGLEDVTRHFSRYGIDPETFRTDLRAMTEPDLVLVTSIMTYWWPGVRETITEIRNVFPRTPVVLGGIYATLCLSHARQHAGADRVVAGPAHRHIFQILEEYTDHRPALRFDPDDLNTYPYPAFDLQHAIAYVPLLTSLGCPYNCAYCAAGFLQPIRMRRQPASVVAEIRYWHERHGVSDFVFYDDALLVDRASHALPMLEQIVASGLKVRFHTPNALHIRAIDRQTARWLYRAGFQTLRLGLETAAADHRPDLDRKVTFSEFEQAVGWLLSVGFDPGQIGVYLLAGLPGQSVESVLASIARVRQTGATPIAAYYTPIPHTGLWDRAAAASRYDLNADPVFTNNAVVPCRKQPFSWHPLTRIKQAASGLAPLPA